MGQINIDRAIRKKVQEVKQILEGEDLDICFLTETGVRAGEEYPDINGYRVLAQGREEGDKAGGGHCMLC